MKALCVGLAVALLALPVSADVVSKSLDVYWVDVEGGAATLIVTPAGESVLIDAGNPGARDSSRIHTVATKVAGLKQIDHLVVTHYHSDHFGGVADLSKLLPIRRVHDNGEPSVGMSERDSGLFAAYTAFASDRRSLVNPGDALQLAQTSGTGRLAFRMLGARQRFVTATSGSGRNSEICGAATEKAPDTSDNANSTVWLLEFGPFRFFDAGDLTWNPEARLVCPANLVGNVDVYQVTHHGLDQSNNPVVLNTLTPTVTVMNNGVRKGTEPMTLATLAAVPSIQARYQVHKNLRDAGNTSDEYVANLDEQCTAHYIKLSVQPDGTRYSIEIPAKGHKKMFDTRAR